jgi:hypothetical protein
LTHCCTSGFCRSTNLPGSLAELAIACRATRSRLDPRLPLVIFADHGFRLSADGRSYRHGGTSTLEQLVPILHLLPR